jgi:hypothetical protein
MLRAWLRVQIPAVAVNFTTNAPPNGWAASACGIRWTRNLMHNLIRECSLQFNDLTEARFDSYFLDFWSAFTIPAGKRNGYQNMIGNFEELTNPKSIGASVVSLPSAVLNLPLPFSHFRETGLALPAAALPYNEMKINFNIRSIFELLIIDNYALGVSSKMTSSQLPAPPSLIADVWAEYALVSNMERIQMGKAPRDMLIEQVQTAQPQPFAAQGNSTNNTQSIHFAHAIKALFFSTRNKSNGAEWSNYTSASPVPTALGVVFSPSLATDPISSTTLFYENTQRLSNMGSDYFSLIQPWYTAVSIPLETGYHLYSYSLDLLNTNPMGSTNYGKLTNVQLSFNPSTDAVVAAATTGTVAAPGPLTSQGAPFAQTYESIIIGINHNIVRIAGGALGKHGKPRIGRCPFNWDKHYFYLVIIMEMMAKCLIMTGNSLEPFLLLAYRKLYEIPRVTTSGIVITKRIGQSAGKESNFDIQAEYDSPSTTARTLVSNDGLANLNWLKIQSASTRKFGDINTRSLCYKPRKSIRNQFEKINRKINFNYQNPLFHILSI